MNDFVVPSNIIAAMKNYFSRWDTKEFLKRLEQSKFKLPRASYPALAHIIGIILEKYVHWNYIYGIWALFDVYVSYDKYRAVREVDYNKLLRLLDQVYKDQKTPVNAVANYPEKFIIELTHSCNLDCIMCGAGKYGYVRENTIDLTTFRRICDTLLDDARVKIVRLNGIGESLIIPNFEEYLNEIRNRQYRIEIFTNLHVPMRRIRRLIDLGARIYVSIDSPYPEKFEFIRRHGNFELFTRNLIKTTEYLKRSQSNTELIVNMTILDCNYTEIPSMIEYLAKCGVKNLLVTMVKEEFGSPWVLEKFDEICYYFKLAEKVAEKYGIEITLPNHLEGVPVKFYKSCVTSNTYCECPWKEVVIRFNGDITACNMMNPFTYGNLFTDISVEHFLQLWNGPNALLFRRVCNTAEKTWYCVNCYHYNPCIKP